MNDSKHDGYSGLRIVVSEPKSESHEDAATRIVQVTFRADPAAASRDYVAVVFNQGFAVGFARMSRTYVVSHSSQEWQEIIRRRFGE